MMNTPFSTRFLTPNLETNERAAESSALLPAVQPSAPLGLASRRGFLGTGLGSIGGAVLPVGLGAWLLAQPEHAQAADPQTCTTRGVKPPNEDTQVWKSAVSDEPATKGCGYDLLKTSFAIYRIDDTTLSIGRLLRFSDKPKSNGSFKEAPQTWEKHVDIKFDKNSHTAKIINEYGSVLSVLTVDSINNPITYQQDYAISPGNDPKDPAGDAMRRRTMDNPAVPGQRTAAAIRQDMIDVVLNIFFDRIRLHQHHLLSVSTPRMRRWLRLLLTPGFDRSGLTVHFQDTETLANQPSFGWRILVRFAEMDANNYFSLTAVRVLRGPGHLLSYLFSLNHIRTENILNQRPNYLDEFRPTPARNTQEDWIDAVFWGYRNTLELLSNFAPQVQTVAYAVAREAFIIFRGRYNRQGLVLQQPTVRHIVSAVFIAINRIRDSANRLELEQTALLRTILSTLTGRADIDLMRLLVNYFLQADTAMELEENPYFFTTTFRDDNPGHRRLIGYTHDRKDLLPKAKKPNIRPPGPCRGCPDHEDIGGPDAVGRRR